MATVEHERPYLSVSQVALGLGVSAHTIRRNVADGELARRPARRAGLEHSDPASGARRLARTEAPMTDAETAAALREAGWILDTPVQTLQGTRQLWRAPDGSRTEWLEDAARELDNDEQRPA
jgi:hypothetical protein